MAALDVVDLYNPVIQNRIRQVVSVGVLGQVHLLISPERILYLRAYIKEHINTFLGREDIKYNIFISDTLNNYRVSFFNNKDLIFNVDVNIQTNGSINNSDILDDKCEIVNHFVTHLLENTEDLDPEISNAVNKHFWELV